jgi:cob(I)alamin adenosyltransferase
VQAASSAPGDGDAGSPAGRLERGLLHVYTGPGKGKSTAAVGLAVRAVGHGLLVFIVWFLKDRAPGGEVKALERLGHVEFAHFASSGAVNPKHPDPKDVEAARQGLARANEVIQSGAFDVVILDEINVALHQGLLDLGSVLTLLESRPAHVEVVCTGRGAPLELMGIADYVTRMESLKHPRERGIGSRKGIDE